MGRSATHILQKPDYFLDIASGRFLNALSERQKRALLTTPLLNFRLIKENRKLVGAITTTYHGDIHGAVKTLISMLAENPAHLHAAENLGYILCYLADPETLEMAWKEFHRAKLIAINDENAPRLLMVKLALMLKLDVEGTNQVVQQNYIEKLVVPGIKNKPKRPIFFWHIPKCSGTSINDIFYRYFYKNNDVDLLPSYAARPLLQHCFQHHGDVFPYMASAHCGNNEIQPPESAFTFTVLRDPVDRVSSMFRQTRTALTYGYLFKQLASYGFFWEKWKTTDFLPWIDNIPPALLLRQLTTFSEAGDVGQATQKVKGLDYYLAHKPDHGSFDTLFQKLELPLRAQDMSKALNKSARGPTITDVEKETLKDILEKEYALLNSVL